MAFIDIIHAGATGIRSFNSAFNVIGNNISNVGTTGFKKSDIHYFESFHDEFKSAIDSPGGLSTINPHEKGFGMFRPDAFVNMSAGHYKETGNLLDLAVQNDGFFIIETNGQQRYTRDGNLAIDQNKDLLQEATSSYIKGFVATLQENGETEVDVNGPLGRIRFDSLDFLPFRSTSDVLFASNLNADSGDRTLETLQPRVEVIDLHNNPQSLETSWTRLGPTSYQYKLSQNGNPAVEARLEIDNLGNIKNWTILNQDEVEVLGDNRNMPENITWNYNSETENGEFERLFMTLTLPQNIRREDRIGQLTHQVRRGKPTDPNFGAEPVVSIRSRFKPGTLHDTITQLVDDKGIVHKAGIVYEHLDTNENIWEYRVYLDKNDPMIQTYLLDPLNNIKDPAKPSLEELEQANDAIFGNTRIGSLDFTEKGFPDEETSIIPTLRGNASPTEVQKLGSTSLINEEAGVSESLDIFVKPIGSEFQYELLLPASSEDIQKLATDPTNGIANPDQISFSDLQKLNGLVFGLSNQGRLIQNRDGTLNTNRSFTPALRGKLGAGQVSSEIPASVFQNVASSFQRKVDPSSGTLNMELDMTLVTGFGGPFSTSVRDQNGYTDGILKLTTITSNGDGVLTGIYSNDEQRTLGQLGLAVFRNAGGLIKSGNNQFTLGNNSGLDENSIGAPNSFTRGLVFPHTLETSNVDLIDEFTEMIITQRALQANSKAVTTSDSLLQTGIGIKR
jgi:flagellar hook-basal body protein